MKYVLFILFAYLAGSIPFAYIIAKCHGINLREVGSGNIGATNLSRALNKRWGYFCFFLDVMKGFTPVFISVQLLCEFSNAFELILVLLTAVASVLGHVFPVYLGFRGGKGVATSFGVGLGLWPYFTLPSLFAFIVWLVSVLISRYISLASMIASIAFPIVLFIMTIILKAWTFEQLWPLYIAAVAIPFLVILRHKENIRRIIRGTESKIFKEKS